MIDQDTLFQRKLMAPDGLEGGPGTEQRGRMLDAMVRAVAEKGYARVSVADVVARAGVSRRTFYEQFTDKEDCFLAAYRLGATLLIAGIGEARSAAASKGLRAQLRAGRQRFTCALSVAPQFARVLLVDIVGAGPRAVELRHQMLDAFMAEFQELVEAARQEDPSMGEVSPVRLRGLVGGVSEVVQQRIVEQGAERLSELDEELEAFMLAVLAAPRIPARRV